MTAATFEQPAFFEWAEAGFGGELVALTCSSDAGNSPGKKPTEPDWQTRPVTEAQLRSWARRDGNVGLRTKLFPAIDIDLDDDAIADATDAVTTACLGETARRTRSNSGRRVLLYRLAGDPFAKCVLKLRLPDGRFGRIEVLANGQQVVVAGMHASGVPNEWRDGQPKASKLATVTEAQVVDLFARLRERLGPLGCTFPAEKLRAQAERRKPLFVRTEAWAEVEPLVEAALRRLDPDIEYEPWINVGMALHAKDPRVTGPAYWAWDSWSSKGTKYLSQGDTEAHWLSFVSGKGINLGTLFAMAELDVAAMLRELHAPPIPAGPPPGWREDPHATIIAPAPAEEPPGPARSPPPSGAPMDGGGPDAAGLVPLTRSYASACRILREPELRAAVLGERALEWNEMNRTVEYGRAPVDEATCGLVRERIELYLCDRKGRPLELGRQTMEDALAQVAREKPYHPIREYLERLRWDEVPRLDHLGEDVLGIAAAPLQRSMLRKWAISAVARAMRPGCKVDSVLILVGPQGALKSTFFATLGGTWFRDSAVDLTNKDSFQVLAGSWLFEWPELETMARSPRSATVKAFVTSRVDSYRAAYARQVQDHPRSCVIVGTTNDDAFLSDATGNRRYWVVPVGAEVNIQLLAENRDQLWAEALAAFESGERWWLDGGEDKELAIVQEAHVITDAWEDAVLTYAAERPKVTVSDILQNALKKPLNQVMRADENRVGAILRRGGYAPARERRVDGRRVRFWRERPSGPTRPILPKNEEAE